MSTNEITVTARKWAHGWELIIDQDNATQVRSLAHATEQVRDYLDTIDPDTDHSQMSIALVPDQEDIAAEIASARQARIAAAGAMQEAAGQSRKVVEQMRHGLGYSLTDTAAILGVTRARVSQLEKEQGAVSI